MPLLQPPLISVGIGTRNRANSVLATVNSILINAYGNFELLIVDQSTNTDTADVLAEARADPRVRYLASGKRGLSQSRNTILAQAHGEIVLMTDDDCIVPADWIEQMHAVFVRHPRAGLVFCRVEAAPFDSEQGMTPAFLCEGEQLLDSITWNTRIKFLGAGMGIRRLVMKQIGGFDVTLGAGGTFPSAEDADIAIRTLLRSIPIVSTDATCVMHDGFRTWQQAHVLMIRDYTGLGAMLSKLIRSGNWPAGIILANLTRDLAGNVLRNVTTNHRRPLGLRHFAWLYRGFYYAWGMPVSRETSMFALSATQAEKLAFLLVDA